MEPLVALMEGEWPDWYNPRGASARADLSERAQRNGLPLGLVALDDGMAVGTCALTMSSGGLVTERSPWLGGLLVHPAYRRRGIGGQLLERARSEARRFGYKTLVRTDCRGRAAVREPALAGDRCHFAGRTAAYDIFDLDGQLRP